MTEAEIKLKVGMDGEPLSRGFRQLKAETQELGGHMEHLAKPGREVHSILHKISEEAPILGGALKFALSPLAGILAGVGFGFNFVKGQIEQAAKAIEDFSNSSNKAMFVWSRFTGQMDASKAQEEIARGMGKFAAKSGPLAAMTLLDERESAISRMDKADQPDARRAALLAAKDTLTGQTSSATTDYNQALKEAMGGALTRPEQGAIGAGVAGLEAQKKAIEEKLAKAKAAQFAEIEGTSPWTDIAKIALTPDLGAKGGRSRIAGQSDKEILDLEAALRRVNQAIEEGTKYRTKMANAEKESTDRVEEKRSALERLQQALVKVNDDLDKLGPAPFYPGTNVPGLPPLESIIGRPSSSYAPSPDPQMDWATGGYAYRPLEDKGGIAYRGLPGSIDLSPKKTPTSDDIARSMELHPIPVKIVDVQTD